MSNNIVQFNEEIIKGQIKELVRGSVEETPMSFWKRRHRLPATNAMRLVRATAAVTMAEISPPLPGM